MYASVNMLRFQNAFRHQIQFRLSEQRRRGHVLQFVRSIRIEARHETPTRGQLHPQLMGQRSSSGLAQASALAPRRLLIGSVDEKSLSATARAMEDKTKQEEQANSDAAQSSNRTLLDRFVDWVSPKYKDSIHGIALYQRCMQISIHDGFYRFCGVPETFCGTYDLCMLHMWILKQRTVLEGQEGHKALEALFAVFFDNLLPALAKNFNISSMILPKYMKENQQILYGQCMAYDAGLEIVTADPTSGALAGALWRNLYRRNEQLNHAHLAQMQDYVRRQIAHVLTIPRDQFFEGSWDFLPPPSALPAADAPVPDITAYRDTMFVKGPE